MHSAPLKTLEFHRVVVVKKEGAKAVVLVRFWLKLLRDAHHKSPGRHKFIASRPYKCF